MCMGWERFVGHHAEEDLSVLSSIHQDGRPALCNLIFCKRGVSANAKDSQKVFPELHDALACPCKHSLWLKGGQCCAPMCYHGLPVC